MQEQCNNQLGTRTVYLFNVTREKWKMSKLDEMIPIATVLDLTEIIPHYGQRVVVEYQIGIFLRQCH